MLPPQRAPGRVSSRRRPGFRRRSRIPWLPGAARQLRVALRARQENVRRARVPPMNLHRPRPSAAPRSGARLPRRRFLSSLAVSTAGALAAPAFLRGQNLNSRLNIAAIGVGGRGASNLGEVARTENVVAICDVFE